MKCRLSCNSQGSSVCTCCNEQLQNCQLSTLCCIMERRVASVVFVKNHFSQFLLGPFHFFEKVFYDFDPAIFACNLKRLIAFEITDVLNIELRRFHKHVKYFKTVIPCCVVQTVPAIFIFLIHQTVPVLSNQLSHYQMPVDHRQSQRKQSVFINLNIYFLDKHTSEVAKLLNIVFSDCLYYFELSSCQIVSKSFYKL